MVSLAPIVIVVQALYSRLSQQDHLRVDDWRMCGLRSSQAGVDDRRPNGTTEKLSDSRLTAVLSMLRYASRYTSSIRECRQWL